MRTWHGACAVRMEAVYAATVPDFCALGPSPGIKAQLPPMTHFEFERMAPTPFGLGFVTHNGEWGADHYAHCYYDPDVPETYFTERMRLLSEEFGFSINKGEDVVEAILDYMLRRDFGPWWGEFLASAAESCGPAHDQQLADAFASPLSQRVPDLTIEQARSQLRSMASTYRWVILMYGQQLATQDQEYIRRVLVDNMARNLGIDAFTADLVMARAEELCVDYRDELDAVAASVRNEMQTTVYALPVCGFLPLTLTLGGVACAILRKRGRL
ncbi:MAG: hypothetical protein NTU83_14370 [Candidatus Hydrogenedentes bacterium]|nr:hypothetical protein [Candidatus Hydrogenedentota bacterium]